MASDKHDQIHKFGAIDRNQVWDQVATLATNAAVIVVIAFFIAVLCVGGI